MRKPQNKIYISKFVKVFSPNKVFLATTPSVAVGNESTSLSKNKVYIAASSSLNHYDQSLWLSPTSPSAPSSPLVSKQNTFLLQQNRILINYKKLTHFENCLLRSREFLKKNFDYIHAQIKAQVAVAANVREQSDQCEKKTTKTKKTKKKKRKLKDKDEKESQQIKCDEIIVKKNKTGRNKKQNEENLKSNKEKEDENDELNISNKSSLSVCKRKSCKIEFSRGMVAFTLQTLKVLNDIDEVYMHI